jgi:hypothetical protein
MMRNRFYNTTYIVFAASIILVYILQQSTDRSAAAIRPWLRLVYMSVEVLETMDECVVAINAASILTNVLRRLEKKLTPQDAEHEPNLAYPATAMSLEIPEHRGQMDGFEASVGDAIMAFNGRGLAPLAAMEGNYDMGFPMQQMADLHGINSLFSELANSNSW